MTAVTTRPAAPLAREEEMALASRLRQIFGIIYTDDAPGHTTLVDLAYWALPPRENQQTLDLCTRALSSHSPLTTEQQIELAQFIITQRAEAAGYRSLYYLACRVAPSSS